MKSSAAQRRGPGPRIRALRHERRMTVEELARYVGISTPSMSRIETNKRWASYENIRRIAQALEVDTSDLFGTPGASVRQDILEGTRFAPPEFNRMVREMYERMGYLGGAEQSVPIGSAVVAKRQKHAS